MAEIRQILPVTGSWYRVLGTKQKPVFERLAFWAVVSYEGDGDVVVGVPIEDIGVFGATDGWRESVAGYLEITALDVSHLEKAPEALSAYSLNWGDN